MDIEEVELVINYDAPPFLKTYVHRVGRTARANKEGNAVTLLRKTEVAHFKEMLRETSNNLVRKHKIDSELLESERPRYEEALTTLKHVLHCERLGLIRADRPVADFSNLPKLPST